MKDSTDGNNQTNATNLLKQGLTAHERQRRLLLKGATGIAAASTVFGVPTIWAQNIKDVTLRQFGTGVSNLNDVAAKVKEDLGFTLEMTALDSDSVAQRAATQPKSFDIADIEYWISATNGYQQDRQLRQDSRHFQKWQVDSRECDCSGYRTALGRFR